MVEAFAPGEIILFGEHSVVYGKNAIALAIRKGIKTVFSDYDTEILIESKLGILNGNILHDGTIEIKHVDVSLEPFISMVERAFEYTGIKKGFKAVITSEIPASSGLASSASVSASFIAGLIYFLGKPINKEELLNLVFASEIDIQKRGSIIGSACAVYGGMIEVSSGKVKNYPLPTNIGEVIIADSKEKCPTAVTTGIVKDKLEEAPEVTQKVFDSMHEIACNGKAFLDEGNISEIGKMMNENQRYLRELGVSTEKIDSYISEINPYVHGSKITGAGGGGCVFSIVKDEYINTVSKISTRLDMDIFRTEFRVDGVQVFKA